MSLSAPDRAEAFSACACGLCFPTSFVLINRASEGMDKGVVNGWSNSCGALVRALWPPLTAWMLGAGAAGHAGCNCNRAPALRLAGPLSELLETGTSSGEQHLRPQTAAREASCRSPFDLLALLPSSSSFVLLVLIVILAVVLIVVLAQSLCLSSSASFVLLVLALVCSLVLPLVLLLLLAIIIVTLIFAS